MFSRDPDSPALREMLSSGGGRATTVIDGWVSVLAADADADPLIELVDVPMTLAGLSRFNVENTLAAASAALAIGIPRDQVVEGLRTFRPDAEHNPGRMNFFSLPGDFSVVMDLAHNEAGLEALLEIMNGVRRPGGRLLLGLGAVGDRQDDLIDKLGEIGARDSDVVAIGHKQGYLRGRTMEEMDGLLRAGAERVGVTDIASYPTEVDCLAALVAQARAGRRGGADVPRGAGEVLRLDHRAPRNSGHTRYAERQGAGCARLSVRRGMAEGGGDDLSGHPLRPYVPDLAVEWLRDHADERARAVEGTMAFVDISGFTALARRLTRQGAVGSEELSDILHAVFSALLAHARREGGDLVKWGGDAVLLLFRGADHATRAVRAAVDMRTELRTAGRAQSSAGRVNLQDVRGPAQRDLPLLPRRRPCAAPRAGGQRSRGQPDRRARRARERRPGARQRRDGGAARRVGAGRGRRGRPAHPPPAGPGPTDAEHRAGR